MSLRSMPKNCQTLYDTGRLSPEESGMTCMRCDCPVWLFRKPGASGFIWGEDVIVVCPKCTLGRKDG